MLRIILSATMALSLILAAASPTRAENEGQAELDKATQLKVTADSLDDLNEVVDHTDSALDKGLDADNKKFAEQLLISTLLQRGQLFADAVFKIPVQDPQRGMHSMQYRSYALSDLQRVVTLDDKVVDAQLLLGKLQSLPLGDPTAARKAFTKVAGSADATADQKAEALALRSATQKDEKDKLDDLNKAVELKGDKPDYLRLRAEYLYQQDKYDEALADVDRALKLDPDHASTHELRGMILLGSNKYDEALKSFDRSSELVPDAALPYQHRGELFRQKGEMEKALTQLNKALELAPDNIGTLLTRAGVYFEQKETEKSLEDIDKAIELQPNLIQPHLMKVEILAATKHVDRAIAHLEKLLRAAPNNEELLRRVGTLYLIDKKPQKAIDAASQILAQDPENVAALQLRGDAYLNIGKHAEAITDFDKALAQKEDDDTLLNNLAWVLATSPDDKLRDGKRALKMATKAAEASGYETPHILSTLAAAYAETGDFENAVKWSQKSVEIADKEIGDAKPQDEKDRLETERDQLKKELESYHESKPVRERQTSEDAPDTHAGTNPAPATETPQAGTSKL